MNEHPAKAWLCAHLVHTLHDGPHRRISWSINCFAIIGWPPWCAINVNLIWLMAHWVGLNEIGHVRLVQHADSCHFFHKTKKTTRQKALIPRKFCAQNNLNYCCWVCYSLKRVNHKMIHKNVRAFKTLPATLESYATPTPHTPLSRAAATSPAHRVPWLKYETGEQRL